MRFTRPRWLGVADGMVFARGNSERNSAKQEKRLGTPWRERLCSTRDRRSARYRPEPVNRSFMWSWCFRRKLRPAARQGGSFAAYTSTAATSDKLTAAKAARFATIGVPLT